MMSDKPLNNAELEYVAELYVFPDYEDAFIIETTALIAIVDSEGGFVCLAPKNKADLLARLINTYEPTTPGEEP